MVLIRERLIRRTPKIFSKKDMILIRERLILVGQKPTKVVPAATSAKDVIGAVAAKNDTDAGKKITGKNSTIFVDYFHNRH